MARNFSDRSLRYLRGVHPDLIRVCHVALHISPVDFIVIDGLRSLEEQAILVANGASRTMNSRHLHGLAVDLMAIDPKTEQGSWREEFYMQLGPAMERAARIEDVPLEWAGRWKTFIEFVHFQLPHKFYRDKMEIPSADPAKIVPLHWKKGDEEKPVLTERQAWEVEMEAALAQAQAVWARKPKD